MEKIFDLFYNEDLVGNCQVEQEGMFYRIICHCHLVTREKIYLWFDKYNLGLCVPTATGCGLTVRVPIKKMDIYNGKFLIKKKRDVQRLYYIDCDDAVCKILENLPDLRLYQGAERTAVYITESPASGLPDSDQIL